MRNDDTEYVRDLERSVRSMEDEIKYLTLELAQRDRIIDELHRDACPTFMGEPLVKSNKAADGSIMNYAMYSGKKGERDGN